MDRGSHVICWAAAILVAVAPLPFGSVDPLPAAALEVCLMLLAIAWVAMRRRAGLTPLPWNDPILVTGVALVVYGLLQMTPAPEGLMELLSPATVALKGSYAPAPPDWPSLSLHPYATWRSCLRGICWTLAALMVRHNAGGSSGRRVVAGGLVAGGLFQAGYGLFEFISGRQHIFGYTKRYFTDVATGTFISRNNYAAYLEMAIPMALAFAVLRLGRGEAGSRTGTGGPAPAIPLKRRLAAATGREGFGALLLLMASFLMMTALLMARSRMGIAAIAAALVLGAVAVAMRGRSRRFALASVAVAGMAALFATQIDIAPVVERFRNSSGELQGGFGRLQVWRDAVPMLGTYPMLGSGLGTWEMAFSPFRTDTAQVRVDFAHNDYLEFLAEAGLAGTIILAAGTALAVRRHAKAWSGRGRQDEIALAAGIGLAALGLHSFTDFHLSIPADALAAAVLVGLLLGRPYETGPSRPTPVEARIGAGGILPLTACALLLAAAALAAASPAWAQMRSAASGMTGVAVPKEDPESIDAGPVVAWAGAPDDDLCPACRLEPWNGMRWIEAAARARRRLLGDVEAIVRVQAEGQIPDPAARLYLARRIDAAADLARRGLVLAPASGRGHLEAGLLHFGRFMLVGLPPGASEDFVEARTEFARALTLQPWLAATHRRVARLMIPFWGQCDDADRAFIQKVCRRALQIDPWASDLKEALARMEGSS
ncbi:MAG TPA: O-antigen ligase family protein [Candidatus Polarisedimenticolia bacterium]|jgi:O-antigen ligase